MIFSGRGTVGAKSASAKAIASPATWAARSRQSAPLPNSAARSGNGRATRWSPSKRAALVAPSTLVLIVARRKGWSSVGGERTSGEDDLDRGLSCIQQTLNYMQV